MFKDILKAKKKVNKVFKKEISAANKKNGPNLDSVFNEKKDVAWTPDILKAKKKVYSYPYRNVLSTIVN